MFYNKSFQSAQSLVVGNGHEGEAKPFLADQADPQGTAWMKSHGQNRPVTSHRHCQFQRSRIIFVVAKLVLVLAQKAIT